MHRADVLDDHQLANRVSRDLSQHGFDHQVREYEGRFEIWVSDEAYSRERANASRLCAKTQNTHPPLSPRNPGIVMR